MSTYTPTNPHRRTMAQDVDPWAVPIYSTARGTKLPTGYANRALASRLSQ